MDPIIKGSSDLNKMFLALRRTASALRRDFGEIENLQSSIKSCTDFVKKATNRIEKSIIEDLMLIRPSAGLLTSNVISEGYGVDEFILSLSGSDNFIRANSNFAISLALRSSEKLQIALVYLPIYEKLYYAESEKGAYLFDSHHSSKIRVSLINDNDEAMIATDSLNLILKKYKNIRISGSVALDLVSVASGKLEALVYEPKDYAEIAAGELILREAGGAIFVDNYLIATNKKIQIL